MNTVIALFGGVIEAAVLCLVVKSAAALADGKSHVDLALGPFSMGSASVARIGGLALGLLTVGLALSAAGAYLVARTSMGALNQARDRLGAAFLRASWDRQARESAGRLQELLTSHVAHVGFSVAATGSAITATLFLVTLAATAVVLQPVAAAAIAVAGAILSLLLRRVRALAVRSGRRHARETSAYALSTTEAASLAREFTAFGVVEGARERLAGQANTAQHSGVQTRFLTLLTPIMFQFTGLALAVGTVIILGSTGSSGSITDVGAIVLLLVRCLTYGQQIMTNLGRLTEAQPYLEEIDEVLDLYESDAGRRGDVDLVGAVSLSLTDVRFSYDDGRPVLDGVGFSVRPGEIVGIVGPSGGGKSTLVHVLLGLREPDSGQYLVNQLPARSYNQHTWSSVVAFVPQDNRVLAASVAENIRFLRREISDEDVVRAARSAALEPDVLAMPAGYDTPLGAGHIDLSGGQRQRLGLARAMAGRPTVLVLDEPTSALDVRTEEAVQRSLTALRGSRTVIVVAHRLSTLSACDRILVLERGQVTGYGSATELGATNAFFREALELSQLPG